MRLSCCIVSSTAPALGRRASGSGISRVAISSTSLLSSSRANIITSTGPNNIYIDSYNPDKFSPKIRNHYAVRIQVLPPCQYHDIHG